jgi:hypothetical protein
MDQMPIIRRVLLGLDVFCLFFVGTCLLMSLPHVLDNLDLEYLVVLGQCVVVLFMFLTGLALLAGLRWAFRMTLVTLALTYMMLAVSLAVGGWAWGAIINGGSAYHALAIGDRIIGQGDLSPVRIDLRLWLVEMSLLTVITIITARTVISRFRRDVIREPVGQ